MDTFLSILGFIAFICLLGAFGGGAVILVIGLGIESHFWSGAIGAVMAQILSSVIVSAIQSGQKK